MRRHPCVPCLLPTVHVQASGLPCLSLEPTQAASQRRGEMCSAMRWCHRCWLCLGAWLAVAGLTAAWGLRPAHAEPEPATERAASSVTELQESPASGPQSDVITFWLRMRRSPATHRDPVVFLRQNGRVVPWPLQRSDWKADAYKLSARLQDVPDRAQGGFEMITLVNSRWVPSPDALRGDVSDAERLCGSGCRIVIQRVQSPHSQSRRSY